MALTATATKQTIATVKRQLSMDDPVVVDLNSDRSNIKYIVKPYIKLEEFTATISSEIVSRRAPKTVIFCSTLKECTEVFAMRKVKLGPKITEPPGFADIVELSCLCHSQE